VAYEFICGGDVDVFKEVIAEDKMSYSVVENIAKTYGYKSGDLMYYLLPGSTIRNGLTLITSNHDVIEMVKLHQGLPIVELYIVSFDEPLPDSEYDTMMMMVMMGGILGSREMIRIGMRYMNRIFLLKIMIFLRLP